MGEYIFFLVENGVFGFWVRKTKFFYEMIRERDKRIFVYAESQEREKEKEKEVNIGEREEGIGRK